LTIAANADIWRKLREGKESETEREYAKYRQPPLHTRFMNDQSGNPRGRPAKNLAALRR
jgi:hypothetical protein